MEEILELKKQLKESEQKVSALEQKLALYEIDGPVGFYYELNRWTNSIREYMRGKTVESLIGVDEKDKTLTNTLALIKSAKENIETLHDMRVMFDKITGKEEDDAGKKVAFIDRLAIKRTV